MVPTYHESIRFLIVAPTMRVPKIITDPADVMDMKTITNTVKAALALRTHANRAKLIRSKIAQYATNPASRANNVKKLTGVDALRLRVGDFRVIFKETADTITILDLGPRGDIYD